MSPKPVGLAYCARPDCGHSVTAHFIDRRGCIVKGCSCKEFLAPGTVVTEVNPEKAAAESPNAYGATEEFESSYADADTPPPFIPYMLPYQPIPLLEPADGNPTIPVGLKGYIVIHSGQIKAGDTVQVIQVESGALQLQPIPATVISTRSPLLQRIYDAIDQGWEDEFDTDCATDAVQDLLVELLQELDAYYYGTLSVPVAELASMVKEGRWIK